MEFLFGFAFTPLNIVLSALYVLTSVCAAAHILLYKEDVKSSIAWLALVFLSPFIGVFLYVFFGINRVRRRAVKLKKREFFDRGNYAEESSKFFGEFFGRHGHFIKLGEEAYYGGFTFSNDILPLQNGTLAYPEMIKAIKSAKKEVLVESYIFDDDEETEKFFEAFKTAAANGAAVKVLIDAIGTLKFFRRSVERRLKEIKGLQYAVFLPPQIPIDMAFVNLRNHRKIMIIDGKTAFFGGMNLSAKNVHPETLKDGVSDITFKIEGGAVWSLSRVFGSDWAFASGEKFAAAAQSPLRASSGSAAARVIADGPDSRNGKIELLNQAMIGAAKKSALIVTPYFLPENNILTALEIAALKGVRVEIILPKKSDHRIMNYAMEPNFERLASKGVKIYFTPPPFDHSKIFVIDGELSCIGSSNWDVRSFRLNFEANMEIVSSDFGALLTQIAESKKKTAELFKLSCSRNLPFFKRLRNNACRLLTPYY
ncbi:MAG: phospholipase D-like domain-containing protein [Endomicrobium sp.]|nr:phospholipase D-like domain-containing protein [Endomicrobium sp.]